MVSLELTIISRAEGASGLQWPLTENCTEKNGGKGHWSRWDGGVDTANSLYSLCAQQPGFQLPVPNFAGSVLWPQSTLGLGTKQAGIDDAPESHPLPMPGRS